VADIDSIIVLTVAPSIWSGIIKIPISLWQKSHDKGMASIIYLVTHSQNLNIPKPVTTLIGTVTPIIINALKIASI